MRHLGALRRAARTATLAAVMSQAATGRVLLTGQLKALYWSAALETARLRRPGRPVDGPAPPRGERSTLPLGRRGSASRGLVPGTKLFENRSTVEAMKAELLLSGFVGQATKGARWMPWHQQAMKDVVSCDKPRGGANNL